MPGRYTAIGRDLFLHPRPQKNQERGTPLAGDAGFFDAERAGERMDADRGGLHVKAVCGNRGVSNARQIRRDAMRRDPPSGNAAWRRR